MPGDRLIILVTVACCLLAINGCVRNDYNSSFYKNLSGPDFPYDMSSPYKKYLMPIQLEEISGIAYYGENVLICVQDEKGRVYFYDLEREKVLKEIRFGKEGDYEGIAFANDTVYVVKSNGDLYIIPLDTASQAIEMITTPFTGKNDIEGLCYFPVAHQLLIACKNSPVINNNGLSGRAVYAFDLVDKQIREEVFLNIKNEDFLNSFNEFETDPKFHTPFKPSDIAVHPISNYIYLISSIGKLMLVFDQDKKITGMIPLSGRLFRQPEGICFSPDGDMFISSEGDESLGYILHYKPVKAE